jgi:hypothetical protein
MINIGAPQCRHTNVGRGAQLSGAGSAGTDGNVRGLCGLVHGAVELPGTGAHARSRTRAAAGANPMIPDPTLSHVSTSQGQSP